MEYIEQNYHDLNLNISTAAYHFGVAPDYLSRCFRRQKGVRLLDYIHTVRIARAKSPMDRDGMTVKEIARSVGYNNSIALIRAFKKYEGVTPGRMQEMVRKLVRRLLIEQGCLPAPRRPPGSSKLQSFRASIEAMVATGLTTSRILREIRELGYTGELGASRGGGLEERLIAWVRRSRDRSKSAHARARSQPRARTARRSATGSAMRPCWEKGKKRPPGKRR